MASETRHSVLQANELSIGYFSKKKNEVIADGIKFDFGQGTLISLVGANGVGKSTLVRTLSGMQKNLGGSISICGKNIKDFHPLELATSLSVVLTEAPVSKNLSVIEFVSLGRQPHTPWMGNLQAKDIEMIDFAMEQTEISEIKNKKCYELSDGQLQRVAIARALAQDTPLILLDEPTTHLDVYHKAAVLKLLKQLARDAKKTIVYSTHEIDLAIQLSDEMILMTRGNTMVGSPKHLISEGHFHHLFPKDTIFFDENTGRFSIKS